jgi:hypothetical protein
MSFESISDKADVKPEFTRQKGIQRNLQPELTRQKGKRLQIITEPEPNEDLLPNFMKIQEFKHVLTNSCNDLLIQKEIAEIESNLRQNLSFTISISLEKKGLLIEYIKRNKELFKNYDIKIDLGDNTHDLSRNITFIHS